MFLRKLMVIVVPLALLLITCIVFPLLNGLGFWSNVVRGFLAGACLAMLLPLSGAGRKKEPFAGLLWVPTVLTLLVVLYQYLAAVEQVAVPIFSLLETTNGQVVLAECLFASYMMVTCLRTKK